MYNVTIFEKIFITGPWNFIEITGLTIMKIYIEK